MKPYLIMAVSLLLGVAGYGNEPNYAVGVIPEALLKNADVVKRNEEIRFEVMGSGETILHKKYALTVLNESGDEQAGFHVGYDKLRQIRSVEGTLYDAMGRVLKRAKGKDFQDNSATSEGSLADDDRVKSHQFYYKVYPYTVEYEVEIRFNHTFYIPAWMPQSYERMAVEKSSYSLVTPESFEVRSKAFHYAGMPQVTTDHNKKVTTWQLNNQGAISEQYAAPTWTDITTSVFFAPVQFSLGDYKGNMSNWKEFGKFIYELKKDRDVLPPDVQQKVATLTAGAQSEREKVSLLYEFLQKNTRYISIQLGIGGWQPFDAAYVAKKGYGDCKALTNYMYSLLKAAGIRSYYTLVDAGEDSRNHQVLEDFPSNQFNHVVLCVPLKTDTMWLECTSQSVPAGYMGGFTGNRKALLIAEEGGTLVSTPCYGINDNVQLRSVKGVLANNGDLQVKINTLYRGLQQDNVYSMLAYLSKDKVKKELNEHLDLSTYEINDFKYAEKKQTMPEVAEDLDISVGHYATVSGKRLFIAPNLLNRSSRRLSDTAERVYDFQFDMAYRDVDTVELEIPAGYAPESMPQDVSLKTKFGTYSSSVRLLNNKLFYLRTREQYAGRFPASDKKELALFFETIYKSDRARVVLVKQ